jgi:hypothetical protein
MHTSDGHSDNVGFPAIADTVGPLLRDGLVPATVDNDLLILDADANQVVRIACADASIADITAVLDTHGLLATTTDQTGGGGCTPTTGLSRRRMLQGAAAAGVVGVTVLTLPTAAMAQSVNPNAPQNVTATAGPEQVTVTWDLVSGKPLAADYEVYYRVFETGEYAPYTGTITVSGATGSAVVTGLTNGTNYQFYVVALPSTQSGVVTATPSPWTGVNGPNGHSVATNGTGTWVALNLDGTAYRSTNNADTWSTAFQTLTLDPVVPGFEWASVAFGNGRFVAVGGNAAGTASRVMWSTDGQTWNDAGTQISGRWKSVAYGNGSWVAVGHNGVVMTSTNNGTEWTKTNTTNGVVPVVDGQWESVAYGLVNLGGDITHTWVAVASDGKVMRSENGGVDWTDRTTANTVIAGNAWYSVAFASVGSGNRFIAVARGSEKKVIFSSSGMSWGVFETGAGPVPVPAGNWASVATNGSGSWIAVADGGPNQVMRSTDNGETWVLEAPVASRNWQGVGYGNARFVAVSPDSTRPAAMWRNQ